MTESNFSPNTYKEFNRFKKRNKRLFLALFISFVLLLLVVIVVSTMIETQNRKIGFITESQLEEVLQKNINKTANQDKVYEYLKKSCLLNIMLSEGFCDSVYTCPAGYKTIGFGHKLRENDKFSKLNFNAAYKLLESDFEKCIGMATELGYYGAKKLAVAHFIYCLGQSKATKIKNFKTDTLNYIYYRGKDGKIKKSENLRKQREFENNLFNQDI